MKQICAWCGAQLGSANPCDEDNVSYGICLACANSVIINVPNELQDFLDQITVPVLLLSYECVLKTANRLACTLLGKNLSHLAEKLAGEVFQCAYSLLPGGCGRTFHCSGCVIRQTVTETHRTGKTFHRVPATLKQHTPEEPQEIKLLISTERFKEFVILKIHGEGFAC